MEVLKPISVTSTITPEHVHVSGEVSGLPISTDSNPDVAVVKTRHLPPIETRFQPGVSGNPSGRPKRKRVTDALGAEADLPLTEEDCHELKLPMKFVGQTRAQVAAKITWNLAMQGDHLALDRIADRLEGRPMSALELRGSEEAPIRVHAGMSDADLALLETIAERYAGGGVIDSKDVRDVSGESESNVQDS